MEFLIESGLAVPAVVDDAELDDGGFDVELELEEVLDDVDRGDDVVGVCDDALELDDAELSVALVCSESSEPRRPKNVAPPLTMMSSMAAMNHTNGPLPPELFFPEPGDCGGGLPGPKELDP